MSPILLHAHANPAPLQNLAKPPTPGLSHGGKADNDPRAAKVAIKTHEEKSGTVLEGTRREMGTRATPPLNPGPPPHRLTREDVAAVPSEQDKDDVAGRTVEGEAGGAGGQADFNMSDSSGQAGQARLEVSAS